MWSKDNTFYTDSQTSSCANRCDTPSNSALPLGWKQLPGRLCCSFSSQLLHVPFMKVLFVWVGNSAFCLVGFFLVLGGGRIAFLLLLFRDILQWIATWCDSCGVLCRARSWSWSWWVPQLSIFYDSKLSFFVRVIGIILWWVGFRTGFPCSLGSWNRNT